MELFKAIVAACLSPLVVALLLQLLGWLLLARRRRAALRLIAAGTGLLLLGSLGGWTWELRRDAEFRYTPLKISELPDERALIVVLGTGFNPDPVLPANSQVGGAFLSRLLEGVRLWRALPASELVISIAGPATNRQKQQFWQQMQVLLGLQQAEVTLLTTAESTLDEAELVAARGSGRLVLLATSASHMPRAVQIFSDEGLRVLAAPCDYGMPRRGSERDRRWPQWVPSVDGLASNHGWLYEQVAGLWQKMRSSFR
jgi:uncharacterized SAM-binding protein YcdF (DUF218 family)